MPDARNYCPIITIERYGFTSDHVVKFNGETAYYRPHDGSSPDEIAQEACAALGRPIGRELGYPSGMPEEEDDD